MYLAVFFFRLTGLSFYPRLFWGFLVLCFGLKKYAIENSFGLFLSLVFIMGLTYQVKDFYNEPSSNNISFSMQIRTYTLQRRTQTQGFSNFWLRYSTISPVINFKWKKCRVIKVLSLVHKWWLMSRKWICQMIFNQG